jgi:hypothetical protein
MRHHPSGELVHESADNASVKSVEPSLEILVRSPAGHHIVVLLGESQMQSDRIVGRARETVISGDAVPRVFYKFHIIKSDLKIKSLPIHHWQAFLYFSIRPAKEFFENTTIRPPVRVINAECDDDGECDANE